MGRGRKGRKMAQKKKDKRYYFSVVEEGIMNPAYAGYRGGRIEVCDDAIRDVVYEARFLVPAEFFDDFCDLWDLNESDLMPMIVWEYKNK